MVELIDCCEGEMRPFLLVAVGLITALAGALISLLVQVVLNDPIESLVVRLSGGLYVRRGRDISGRWFTLFLVTPEVTTTQSARLAGKKVERIKLSKVRHHVVGRKEDDEHYRIRATLIDRHVLTGTWENYFGGSNHYGSFQLFWDNDGRSMGGKFLGKDSNNHINHGIWLWARELEELLPLAEDMKGFGGYDFDIEEVKRILKP